MDKIPPLISSGTAGPLGVLHLPRLWLKVTLKEAGRLPDDYPECGKGYDQMVLDGLGLDRDATLKYLHSQRPSYTEFEAWVKSQPGVKLDKANVQKLNSAITGYIHADDTRRDILGACGIRDEGKLKDAVNLNNLDDWTALHKAAFKK